MRECRHDLGRPHVFVKTRTKEFHYPKGDDNVTTTYDGEGGVAVNSFFRKNQQGSQVIQGTLLVVPIEESLLYIRPLYLRAAGGRIPEMKRVIVAHQNQIVMEETLEAALERIFPSGKGPPGPPVGSPPAADQAGSGFANLAARAQEHYQRALKAQRDGDWALYGEEIRRLGEALELMKKQR